MLGISPAVLCPHLVGGVVAGVGDGVGHAEADAQLPGPLLPRLAPGPLLWHSVSWGRWVNMLCLGLNR